MRHLGPRLITAWLLVVSGLSVACAGPHSTGALWARQNLEQERAMYQQSDAQRAGVARAFELGLADESLQAERQRITTALQNCPGASQPVGVSPGNSVRDVVRVRARADPARLAEVSQLALADWYARRASATGNTQFCEQAQAALSGLLTDAPAPGTLLASTPAATVSRDPNVPTPPLSSDPPLLTLSQYALGSLDSVTAAAPLPQYLALVYGGSLSSSATMDAESAADLVDRQAPAYPNWEPDALYAALLGARA
jgi:hypothetical protein